MDLGQTNYLPLAPGFFSILVGFFVLVLVQLGLLRALDAQIGDFREAA